MRQKNFLYKIRLYIFFLSCVLIFIKFSTSIVNAEIYKITKIKLSKPYELNFNKQIVIENAFENAFRELIKKITISKDFLKIQNTNIKTVKNLVDSFTVVDEKFVDNKYFATFEVNFNKKLVHNYLEKKNIFTSIPIEKELFIMPVLLDLDKKQTLLFSENFFYNNWNNNPEKYHLLKYILPNEDLDDIVIIKKNFENIEDYDFKEIISKYDIKDYIIIIFFKNNENIRVLSKITLNKNNIIVNEVFNNVNFHNIKSTEEIISILKTKFENQWKKMNQINTSIKFPITIQIESKNYELIQKLEYELLKLDLVSNFYIENFDSKITTYKIIYNGTPDRFIKEINKNNISLNTSFKTWRIE
tara:strand:- start:87 stop:1163 length:1077 start_codon:yes stop_codon:yes gene_type:complete